MTSVRHHLRQLHRKILTATCETFKIFTILHKRLFGIIIKKDEFNFYQEFGNHILNTFVTRLLLAARGFMQGIPIVSILNPRTYHNLGHSIERNNTPSSITFS